MTTQGDKGGRYLIAVDPARFDSVVDRLRQVGVTVESTQPTIGTVVATMNDGALGEVSAVDGVEAVERERQLRIPESDSPLQ